MYACHCFLVVGTVVNVAVFVVHVLYIDAPAFGIAVVIAILLNSIVVEIGDLVIVIIFYFRRLFQ